MRERGPGGSRPAMVAADGEHASSRQCGGGERERPPARTGRGSDALELTPAEGYLLSRIDGATSWTHLRAIGGIGAEEVDRCLERWLATGVVVVEGEAAAVGRPRRRPRPNPRAAARDERAVHAAARRRRESRHSRRGAGTHLRVRGEARLALPRDPRRSPRRRPQGAAQGVLRALEGTASGPLLPAQRRSVRQTPRAHLRQDRRGLRVALGSDGARRDRALARRRKRRCGGRSRRRDAVQPPRARCPPEAESQRAPTAPPRSRRPHVFSLHSRIVRDRRARAKRLFEAGMASYAGGRWLEAAGSVRLAIAFDPWNAVLQGAVRRRPAQGARRARQAARARGGERSRAARLPDRAARLRRGARVSAP